MIKEKIKNFEFLRVIGCMAIVFLHFYHLGLAKAFNDISLYKHLGNMTLNGQKAVDLFFIISGFLFVYTYNSKKSLFQFIKGKIIRFYPVLIFVILLSLVLSFFHLCHFAFYENILSLLCLDGTGLTLCRGNVGVFWYVSSMLWVLVLYTYILKYYKKETVNLLIAISIFFSYGFIIHAQDGHIWGHLSTYYNIFNIQMLRAFGAIGIGYFIGEWYKTNHQQIKDFTISAKQKLVVTVLEFCCLFYIINNLMLRLPKFHNDLFYIVCFTAIIILFLAKKGYISTWLDNDKWAGLSKYTYSIYMTHPVIITAMKCSVWKYHKAWVYNHPCINIIIALTLILALGVFTYEFVEKKANDYFKKRALQKVA